MKYLKFTYVDSVTNISIASQQPTNGPKMPPVVGLEFVWARESRYPTDVPEFFGTCPDDSETQIDGVLGVFVEADFLSMQADEMLAREAKAKAGKRITRRAFRDRFTLAEKIAIEIAALDNPGAPMEQRAQAAALRANQADLAVALWIDLTSDGVRSGVQMLEVAGLLTAGRAVEILGSPVMPDELAA